MNNAKHTPGPWVVTEHSAGMICVAGPNNKDLCAVGYNRTEGRNDVANATLIAAAPAMYEALHSALNNVDRLGDVRSAYRATWIKQVTKLLAQAEGR